MSTLTPDERVRQQIAREVSPDIVLAIYRAMKGNRHARWEDISPAALATLATEVRQLLSAKELQRRITLVNVLSGHENALKAAEDADVARQATRDRRRAHDLTAIKAIVPGMCCLCVQAIGAERAGVLQVTDALSDDVHEACAQTHPSIEMTSSIGYRLKGVE